MKILEVRSLLKDKRVIEEINKHLWIESQKVGYSIGLERATDEWLQLYSEGWMKYNLPKKDNPLKEKKKAVAAKKKIKAASKKSNVANKPMKQKGASKRK